MVLIVSNVHQRRRVDGASAATVTGRRLEIDKLALGGVTVQFLGPTATGVHLSCR